MARSSPLAFAFPLVLLAPPALAGGAVPSSWLGGARGSAAPRPEYDVLDFEAPAPGTVVTAVEGIYGLGPVGVRATSVRLGDANAALSFDSGAPTGGDRDLGTPHADFGGPGLGVGGALDAYFENGRAQGRLLVVAQDLKDKDHDGRIDDPGGVDGATPCEIVLDFAAVAPVVLAGLSVLDVERGGTIVLCDADGATLSVVEVPITGDNGAAWVDLGERRGVQRLRLRLNGSGGIDDVLFRPDAAGFVESVVWHDADGDGLRSSEEEGLSGVRVRLADAHGRRLASAVTRWNGAFRFSDLAAGTYLVELEQDSLPVHLTETVCDVGGDEAADSDCSPAVVTLATNDEQVFDLGFGLASACPGGLGNRIWFDDDADGLQDESEPGIEGVRITLRDAAGLELAQQTTGPNGLYKFIGLCEGTYTLEVDPATLAYFFTPSPCDVGSDDTLDSDCSPITVVIPPGTNSENVTIDFGYQSPFEGRIGDFVWSDVDCDGFQDDPLTAFGAPLEVERGIGGGRIILRDDMGVIIGETTSNATGRYEFVGLPDGRYTLEVELASLPPGLVPSFCNPGLNDDRDNDCTGVEVVVEEATTDGGAVTLIYDFGFRSEPCNGFACATAFWKANPAAWPAPYAPDQLFSDVFDTVYLPGMTLLEVLCTEGGGAYAFAREALTALLNAASAPTVDYALPPGDVIVLFGEAFAGQIDEVLRRTDYFRFLNEQNCPLQGQ